MKKWLILLTICLDWSLMWVDFTAVNVALAPIANDLHTNLNTLQWVITAYTLCSSAFMAVGGRLGDMYGHKRLFIIGTLIFTISSVLAGFSPNTNTLILSRIGQGIGIAFVVPITTALVYLTFEQAQRGLALGFLTGTTGVSMAIGPTVGGFLITYFNWRWVFFINLPIGIFAMIMALILIKETAEKKKSRLDIWGITTLVTALVSLLFALNKISEWGLFSPNFLGLFILSIFLLFAFIRIEIKQKNPLIHIELLTNKMLMGVIGLRTCAQYAFFVYMFVLSLYLQNILGYSADKAGYLFLAATIVLGVSSPYAGKLVNRYSLRGLIAISCLIISLSFISLMLSSIINSTSFLIFSLVLFGLAYAIHFPTTNLAVLQTGPTNQSALVTGMLFTVAFAGASVGITVSSSLLSKLSAYKLNQLLALADIKLNSPQLLAIHNAASGAQSLSKNIYNLPAALVNQIISMIHQSFLFGFLAVLMICVLLGVLAMWLALKTITTKKINNKTYILDI